MFGRLEQGDLGDRGDQGAPVLESSGFQKYSICRVFKALCLFLCLCIFFVVVFVIVLVFVFVSSSYFLIALIITFQNIVIGVYESYEQR